jgi:hypothetical protein
VDSYSFSGKTKVRLGKLDGITDTDAGLDGSQNDYYGLYSDNAHLKGVIYSQEGEIAGWTIDTETISKGFIYISSLFNSSGYTASSINEIGRGLYINTAEESSGDTTIQVGQIYPVTGASDTICFGQFDNTYGYEYGINICQIISGVDPEETQRVLFRAGEASGAIAGLSFNNNRFYVDSDTNNYFRYDFTTTDAWQFKYHLDVQGELTVDGEFSVTGTNDGGLTDAPVKLYNLDSSASTPVLNLYQGASASDRKVLRVYSDYDSSGGTDEGGLQIYNGTLQIQQGSDLNRKKSITTINNGISVLNKIRPVEFLWKDHRKNPENKTKVASFIAQEIEKVLPNMVSSNDEGEKFISINYIIPYMVSAIQELNNQVEKLKTKEKL